VVLPISRKFGWVPLERLTFPSFVWEQPPRNTKNNTLAIVKIVKALVIQFDYLALLLVPGLLDVAGANNPHPLPVFSILTSETVLFSKRITNSCPSYVP
jgi:hypothetical protein